MTKLTQSIPYDPTSYLRAKVGDFVWVSTIQQNACIAGQLIESEIAYIIDITFFENIEMYHFIVRMYNYHNNSIREIGISESDIIREVAPEIVQQIEEYETKLASLEDNNPIYIGRKRKLDQCE